MMFMLYECDAHHMMFMLNECDAHHMMSRYMDMMLII